jgi:D-alanyl-D-alanine carboxypeptidase (penicillin-binding protein 5/6)
MNRKKLYIYILTLFIVFSCVLPVSCSFATTEEPTVNAPVALLMDSNTGEILYEKNAREKMYPASTTKIMTAILALENRELTDTATVSYNAIFSVPSGYSNANLQLDEVLTYEQLLYVLLIPSANDAANVIAEDIAGSVESFATMMNTKAREIGCENTNFVNANGVHDENHYSTAYDLALIGRYAMQNETFRKFVSTVRYTLPATNKYETDDRIFLTTNRLINSKSGQYYEYATGIKTGYTEMAKNCIVASAKKNDMELICVILGASNDSNSTNKFSDCITLFDYGFDNYKYETLCQANSVFKIITPRCTSKDTKNLEVLYESDISALMKSSEYVDDFSPEVELDENLKAPITKGSVIGKVTYTVDGIKYTTNLIAGQDILASSVTSIIIKIILVVFALYILKSIVTFSNKGSKKGKKKHKSNKKTSKSAHSAYYRFEYND